MPAAPSSLSIRACALALLLVGLLSAALFLFTRPSSPVKSAPEIPRSALVLREGKLFMKDATLPFTGTMVEHYADGALKSRSRVLDGLLQGLSEGWHTNGVLQVTETFERGVSHGTRTKWHENGCKMSEAAIVNGQLHGTFRRWTDQGQLSEKVEMSQGQPEGLSVAFYPSGSIKAEAMMRAGEVQEQHFWKDGDRQSPTLGSAERVNN